jgi:hypothetical protein
MAKLKDLAGLAALGMLGYKMSQGDKSTTDSKVVKQHLKKRCSDNDALAPQIGKNPCLGYLQQKIAL